LTYRITQSFKPNEPTKKRFTYKSSLFNDENTGNVFLSKKRGSGGKWVKLGKSTESNRANGYIKLVKLPDVPFNTNTLDCMYISNLLGLTKDFSQTNVEYNYFASPFKEKYINFLIYGDKNFNKDLNFGINPMDYYETLLHDQEKCLKRGDLVQFNQGTMLIAELEKSLEDLPIIESKIIDQIKKKKPSKRRFYRCKIDGCSFSCKTSQGLGGHTSKVHPNTSQKYLNKQMIRDARAGRRLQMFEVKKCYLKEKGFNYDELTGNTEGRYRLNELIRSCEYKKFKKRYLSKSKTKV
jgi:hypothetical protein